MAAIAGDNSNHRRRSEGIAVIAGMIAIAGNGIDHRQWHQSSMMGVIAGNGSNRRE